MPLSVRLDVPLDIQHLDRFLLLAEFYHAGIYHQGLSGELIDELWLLPAWTYLCLSQVGPLIHKSAI